MNNACVLTFYLSSKSVCRVRPKLKRLRSSTQIIFITRIMERYAALFFDTIRDNNLSKVCQEILIAFRGDIEAANFGGPKYPQGNLSEI